MRKLDGLKPEKVFFYFEEICSIPHGSGNTDKISDYCVEFAKKHNLEYVKDSFNNVIIKKAATDGYQSHPPVIIQGHLDMVCEKEEDATINMVTEGLDITHNDEYVYANGTTLGGDDGIAVAMALAILDDNSIVHPPLEVVFTTDEETGMDGAVGLDTSSLKAKTLLNIDSECEGVLTVSCAGGAHVQITIPLNSEITEGNCYKIKVDGLIGGHSGVEIDKGRLNSNKAIAKLLSTFDFDYKIAKINGGLKDNAIPRTSECVIFTDKDIESYCKKFQNCNKISTDPDLTVSVSKSNCKADAFTKADSKKLVEFLSTVENGVIKMSTDIDGLVQTSLNLGILVSDQNSISASFAVRSSKNNEKIELIEALKTHAEAFGGTLKSSSHYPAWEYKQNSRLRDTMVSVYKNMYGKSPVVEAIHAGLECGLFCDKIEDLDAVSFGPDMCDIHTTRERLNIESTKRTFEYLCNVLKEL